MAENPAQRSQSDRSRHPDPPTLHALNRAAGKIYHAGFACLTILARPNTVGPLLFSCICLALAYKHRRRAGNTLGRRRGGHGKPGGPCRPVLQRSMSMALLHGGRLALERMIDAQEARLDEEKLERAEAELEKLLNPADGRMNFSKLQSVVGKLEMSGKEDDAVVLLRKAMEKANPHEAHELGMLLVEMLIYKGDYDEALSCPCLYDEGITDARSALYKAVVYSLKGDEKAEEHYKSFQDVQARLHAPKEESPLSEVVHDFNKFQTIVKNLKKEIEKAKGEKLLGNVIR